MITGGKRLRDKIRAIGQVSGTIQVGFMDRATYQRGQLVAAVAYVNESGADIKIQERQTTIYRKINKSCTDFLNKGRFVKKRFSNFATTHTVPAYSITIPSRPFFKTMVKDDSPHWPGIFARALVARNYNSDIALNLTGLHIHDALVNSIRGTWEPPNAKSTIRRKGFDKPLTGMEHQLTRTITYRVVAL